MARSSGREVSKSLNSKFISLVVVITLGSGVVLASVLAFNSVYIIEQNFNRERGQLLNQSIEKLDEFVSSYRSEMKLWATQPIVEVYAKNPAMASISIPALRAYFSRIFYGLPWREGVWIVDGGIRGFTYYSDQVNNPKRVFPADIEPYMDDHELSLWVSEVADNSGELHSVLFIKEPLVINSEIAHGKFLVALVNLTKVQEKLFSGTRVGELGYLTLVAETASGELWFPELPELIKKLLSYSEWRRFQDIPINSESHLYDLARLDASPLAVLSISSRAELMQPLYRQLILAIGVLLVVLLLVFFVVKRVAGRVTRPLMMLAERAGGLDLDSLDQSTGEDYQTGFSEIDILNDAFVRMVEKLAFSRNEMEKAFISVKDSQMQYRNVFDNAEVSIWNEDFSQLVESLAELRVRGVTCLREFLEENIEEAWRLATLVKVVGVNKATLVLFEANTEEEFISSIDKVFGEGSIDVFIDELCAIWEEKPFFRTEATQLTLGGKELNVIISMPIPKSKNLFRSIPVSILDITEQKQAEVSLRRSSKMEAIGQLTGGIAHDFNNILGIVMGNLELIKKDLVDDKKVTKRVGSALKAAGRASDLTKKLLSFSRTEVSHHESCKVNKLVLGMQDIIERSLTPVIEINLKLNNNLWLIDTNYGELEDSLLNLALNARDAIIGSGKLSIKTENIHLDIGAQPGDYVLVAISDTGEGMPPEVVEHIFEPFFTTKSEGKGTGLGLSMVFGFVERSKGFITVDSKEGFGTTFNLYFPRSFSVGANDRSSPDITSLEYQGSGCVLVVDDEEALVDIAKAALTEMGYEVLTAASAHEALYVLTNHPRVDILFSDVVMPGGMSGYELAEHAYTLKPDLKVLLTSGYTKNAATTGDDVSKLNVLSKPYSISKLAQAIYQVTR